MKTFVASLFALAAGANADADPQLLVQSPVVASSPFIQAVASPYFVQPTIAKADEQDENKVNEFEYQPQADPFLLYNGAFAGALTTPYAGTYATQYAANPWINAYANNAYANAYTNTWANQYVAGPVAGRVSTYANDRVVPNNYAAKGSYAAVNAGAIHIAKRSADADADPALVYATATGAYVNSPYVAAGLPIHTAATVPYAAINPAAYTYPAAAGYTAANTLAYNNYYQPYGAPAYYY